MVIVNGNSGSSHVHQRLPVNQLGIATVTSNCHLNEEKSTQEDSKMNDQQQQQLKDNDDDRTNLIINYLPQSMTEKELYSMFVTIGPVESCRVMKDYKTGYSYGFGFVNYAKADDAATAINTLNGLQVQNKRLKVSFARPSGEEIKETNLYVTNLPRNITEKQVEEIFSKFGQIVQKNILKDKLTGLPRGVAFVRYDKREEAQDAINQLHGTIPDGGSEPLSVKIAEEHGKQKAAYYAGWQAGYNQSRALLEKKINVAMLEDELGDLRLREQTKPVKKTHRKSSGGGGGGGGGAVGRGRGGYGGVPPLGMGLGGGAGLAAGGPPGAMLAGRGGFGGPRGGGAGAGHHGFGGGPGAVRMEKLHPHRFNPLGMSGAAAGAAGGANAPGGYAQPHFW